VAKRLERWIREDVGPLRDKPAELALRASLLPGPSAPELLGHGLLLRARRRGRPLPAGQGEADLKHLHDVYVGGYGQRSERAAYEWMEREFDMRIVKVRETDPYLYHLDCTVFPLTREDTLVCTEMFEREEVAAIERHTTSSMSRSTSASQGSATRCGSRTRS